MSARQDKFTKNGLGATPMDASRSCTDSVCSLVFLAALGGLVFCITRAYGEGDISRLTSLPDSEGNQCGTNGRGQFIFFCASGSGIDLTHQVCVDSCPTSKSDTVDCSQSVSSALGAATSSGSSSAYASTPVAGVLCVPTGGEQLAELKKFLGDSQWLEIGLQVAQAFRNTEIIIIAAVTSVLMALLYLFLVDHFAKVLVYIGMSIMAIIPAVLGGYFIYTFQQGGTSGVSSHVVNAASASGVKEITSAQADLTIGVVCLILSFLIVCIVCCKTSSIAKAAEAVEEAADCIFHTPSLLIEPFLSFILKVPVFVLGVVVILLLITSGDYTNVDLTQPSTLLHPDNLSVVCIIYAIFVFLWVLELFHYVSVFVVIYVGETWFFTTRGKLRGSLCSNCGPTVMVAGYCAALRFHLGSLIYGSLLSTVFRLVRVVIQTILSLQDNGNPVGRCISCVVGCCLACLQKIIDLTSKVAFMEIAMTGNVGYCTATTRALSEIFSNGVTWAAVEGMSSLFMLTGVGAIGASTGAAIWVITSNVARYKDVNSPEYVSDPKNAAIAAAVVGSLLALIWLHLLDTLADTMAYCKGVQQQRKKFDEGDDGAAYAHCFGCFNNKSSETKSLLRS